MSSGLMDTEKGGEQTQYEAENSDMLPHKQEAGQLGGTISISKIYHDFDRPPNAATATTVPSTEQPTQLDNSKTNEPNTQGITPADKIRYGQSIQEGGMGGKTNTTTGETDKATDEDSATKARREQGYDGGKDMDRNIGA
ncbi:uncharacterized protein EKO05_0006308 [Ascochyta rabiei]|uniref:Uncharacterized protein n=1 Tax=Didymella rabiei TaxID=5454 RepID=A0A163APM3_DIDRA|nr:uncharacterized protein EKO05_0006308 [Ascochyta rabiei]KZM21312.1 hypothetical protein ST47_g7547 [Ascochyta rabiei]UPX15872.1 hypothetical protein EKO05_0006308 [Ascochyta rabiei]